MLVCPAKCVPFLRPPRIRSTCIDRLLIVMLLFHSRLNEPFCVMLLLYEVNAETERSLYIQ